MIENSEWRRNASLVIAHRGASFYAPENTLAAFREAVAMKADAVELDAKLLKDGTIVVLHDATLDRTTDGSGSIYRYSYDEIKGLDAGSHFSRKFSKETIPRLDRVFEEIGEELLINIELTNYAKPWDRLPFEVISLVRKYQLKMKVLLSSFNPWSLMAAKRLDPEIPRAILVHPEEPRFFRVLFKKIVDYVAYHPHQSMVSEEVIIDEKKRQKRINVWTVNEKDQMEKLLDLGVDGLITDCPDIAREAVHEMEAR